MAIESNQVSVNLNTLYKVDALSKGDIQRNINASVWVNSGSVDIYASDSATAPASLADMTLNTDDTNVAGKNQIVALSNYIAFVQNTGTSTEVILSGVSAVDNGAIS